MLKVCSLNTTLNLSRSFNEFNCVSLFSAHPHGSKQTEAERMNQDTQIVAFCRKKNENKTNENRTEVKRAARNVNELNSFS